MFTERTFFVVSIHFVNTMSKFSVPPNYYSEGDVITLERWAKLLGCNIPFFRGIYVSILEPEIIVVTRGRDPHLMRYGIEPDFDGRKNFLGARPCEWNSAYMEYRFSVCEEHLDEWKYSLLETPTKPAKLEVVV